MFVRTALFVSACAVLLAGLVVLGVKLAGPAPQPTPMAAASPSPTPTKLPKAVGLLLIAESSGHRRLPDISATSAWAAARAAIRTGLAGPSRSLAGWWRLKPDASDDGVILFARKTVDKTPTVPTVPVRMTNGRYVVDHHTWFVTFIGKNAWQSNALPCPEQC